MSAGAENARLAAFLRADSDAAAQAALAAIFDAAIERLLTETVRRSLAGSSRGAADADDVISETRVRLIRRLWAIRNEGADPIDDVAAYVATTATRTCYAHLRERFPARTRFRNQVRYSVMRHPDTTLESADGVWICRTTALRGAPAPGSLQQFVDAPATFLSSHRIDTSKPLPHLIAAVLARLDAPIELDRLVDALANVMGVVEIRAVTQGADEDVLALERVADPSPDRLRELADREALEGLWREVIALPVNQRVALLMNLRDPDGGAALHAIPATGIATRAQLAELLDVTALDLDELWDELPLDDLKIGGRLGLTRQQVINLRKSARARLARRIDRE
jgi:DNA-directed RNA polymerase specialized sigma24 family protein